MGGRGRGSRKGATGADMLRGGWRRGIVRGSRGRSTGGCGHKIGGEGVEGGKGQAETRGGERRGAGGGRGCRRTRENNHRRTPTSDLGIGWMASFQLFPVVTHASMPVSISRRIAENERRSNTYCLRHPTNTPQRG